MVLHSGSTLQPPTPPPPQSSGLFNLNVMSLEAVSRYRDTQLQVTDKLCDKFVTFKSPHLYIGYIHDISVSRLKAYFTFNNWLYLYTEADKWLL